MLRRCGCTITVTCSVSKLDTTVWKQKLVSTNLDGVRVTGLTQDFEQDRVGHEEEARKKETLSLQIAENIKSYTCTCTCIREEMI